MTLSRPLSTVAAVALFGVAALVPRDSLACGGFFCSATPVDQTAEHILFTLNDDHTVTAIIQISYTGQKDAFAWIVPVGGVPTLTADFPELALRGLDVATQPQYFRNGCFFGEGDLAGAPTGAGGTANASNGGVTVIAQQNVGPYETVTLSGTNAAGLVDWLQQHGYRVTDSMKPIIAPYVADGSNFVAMRLQPDKDVSDITPLSMTYPGNQPSIPIRLTAVAATPEMGIVAFVLGSRRYRPENFVDLEIPDSLIHFDQYNQNDYQKVVSVESDKVGGQAFVTEYAKATGDLRTQVETQNVPNADAQAAKDAILPLLTKFPYLTRLYARMSAEEMTADPFFGQSPDSTDVTNVHDLTDPDFDYSQCSNQPPTPPDPCLQTYCGRHGVCTAAEVALAGAAPDANGVTPTTAMPACFCAANATARSIPGPNGQPTMYCEPLAQNLDAPATGLSVAACEGVDCGPHGECTSMNQNATCRCEAGYGAVVRTQYDSTTGTNLRVVTCEKPSGPIPPLPNLPVAGNGARSSMDSGGCGVAPGRRSGAGAAGMLLGLAAAVLAAGRRRRAA